MQKKEEQMFDIKFGFKSFKDLIASTFGTWYPVMSLFGGVIIGLFYFGWAAIYGYIDHYWFSPVASIITVMGAIVLDWAFGVYGAWKRQELSTRLAQRVVPMIIINFLLLSLFYNIVKYQVSDFGELAATIGFIFCKASALYLSGVHAVSALKNAVKAKVTNADWANWVVAKIDKYKEKLDDTV